MTTRKYTIQISQISLGSLNLFSSNWRGSRFVWKCIDQSLYLKKNDPYYYHVCLLHVFSTVFFFVYRSNINFFCTNKMYNDFILWTKDETLWLIYVEKALVPHCNLAWADWEVVFMITKECCSCSDHATWACTIHQHCSLSNCTIHHYCFRSLLLLPTSREWGNDSNYSCLYALFHFECLNPLGPRGQIWDTYVSCVNEFTCVSTLAATWFYSSFSH